MGAAAAEADRTLFVGNLDPKVTEELLFELFHQAGPVIKVKIPKDRDGKAKQFAFVNFKHEESVPYGMSLLNGIKLFGRPLKIQFRSGSSHASQDGSLAYTQHASANGSPSSVQPLSATVGSNRYERNMDNMSAGLTTIQRSFSSPENLQRQAVMNNLMWQQLPYSGRSGSLHSESSGFASPGHQPSYAFPPPRHPESRKNRVNSHPYQAEGRHYTREHQRSGDCGSEHHFRASRDEYGHDDRNYRGWSQDYDNRRESHREGKWHPSRH
ncbi:RNA-binding protein 7 isoform X1 [Pogona vitticeps]|uniref:RNA-binding protein 7 isoform X1 n=2 Tax=Pogona vitticeps TaxID=103695 RepID=A0A6J0TNV0_9SAUR